MSQADFSQADAGRAVFVRKQTANIYTMMLILAFLAISIGCLFLFLELKAYDGLSTQVTSDAKVPPPQVFETPEPAAAPDNAPTPNPDNASIIRFSPFAVS